VHSSLELIVPALSFPSFSPSLMHHHGMHFDTQFRPVPMDFPAAPNSIQSPARVDKLKEHYAIPFDGLSSLETDEIALEFIAI
jgi:hypothetical protein